MARLFVTTSHSFLELDTATASFRTLHSGKGLYYGIAQSPQHMFLACRNRSVSSGIPVEEERGEIAVFDPAGPSIAFQTAPFPLRDMHEIAWHNDRLWITCPHDNVVVIWDGETWERWHPLPDDHHAEGDIHHYNSFLFLDYGFWLVAHNHGDSEVLFFSLPERRLQRQITLGRIAHNIWEEDGQLFTCSSAEGDVVGDRGFRFKIGGFPRGYAQDESGMRFVGINEYAERAKRDATSAKIVMFDRKWCEVETFHLPDQGMILDIRRSSPVPSGSWARSPTGTRK
jgi:hypothetical protein